MLLAAGMSTAPAEAEGLRVVRLGDRDRALIRADLDAQGLRWVGVLDTDHAIVRAAPGRAAEWRDGIRALDESLKTPASLRPLLAAAQGDVHGPVATYHLIATDRTRATRRRIAAIARGLGGIPGVIESDALTMRITIDTQGLARLLGSPDVLWAEPAAEPSPDDEFVRDFGGANYVELLDGFTGAGVACEVVDGGLYASHADFAASPPVVRTPNAYATDHGTSTYGLLFGDGASDGTAFGMIPDAIGLFSSYHEIDDRDANLASLAGPPYFGVLQSNSWGTGITRRYTAASAELDDAIFRRGVIVIQSQSNTGSPDSRPEAWAKNVVSVGGVQGRGTLDRSDDTWGGYASTGPALDGRVKPDLVMFNDGIWTPADTGSSDHRSFTGTSAATPAVAGHFGVMLEMWNAGYFDQAGQTNQPADQSPPAPPSVAAARALMVNSASAYPFSSVADDLGRYRQGWGTPDLRRLRDDAPRTFVLDESAPLVQGQTWAGTLIVAEGESSLRVTMAYSDPAALPLAVGALVNDLDLRVTAPSGVVYHGNAGLHDGVWSTPGGVPDRVNTVENVLVEAPEPGAWQIEVRAYRVNEDADDSTPEFDAPFALIAAGVTSQAGPALCPVGDIPPTAVAEQPFAIELEAIGFTPSGDGVLLVNGDSTLSTFPLVWDGGTRFTATLEGLACGSVAGLRFSVPMSGGGSAAYPPGPVGSVEVRAASPAARVPLGDWAATAGPGLASGAWTRGMPSGGGLRWDPPTDADGDDECWLTDNRAGASDVSGGSATLTTPAFDIGAADAATLRYDLWLACDDAGAGGEDTMLVECSTDDGASWSVLSVERSTFRWTPREIPLAGLVGPGGRVRFRFTVGDAPDNSITEAGIDGLAVVVDLCAPCPADVTGDGITDLRDLNDFVVAFLDQQASADFDGNGTIDLSDLLLFLASFGAGCAG